MLNKIPTGLHISLNTRLEHLAGVYDDLPAHVGHYLRDLGSEGGQGVIRLFIDLSLNFAPHEIIKGLQSCELGGKISFDQWFFQAVLQPAWVILALSAREAFGIAAEVLHSAHIFCS